MTDTAPPAAGTSPAEPDGAARSIVLDVLRGLAILAILFLNIPGMGGPLHGFLADPQYFGWSPADRVAWWSVEVALEGTARAMLEMLFGAGMVILTDRAATRMGKWAVFRQYAWRNIVLFAFGLIHVFVLLWPGDILHTYAVAALLLVLFRRWRARWMLVAGLAMATLMMVGISTGIVLERQQDRLVAEARAAERAGRTPAAAQAKALAEERKEDGERAERRAKRDRELAAENRLRTGDGAGWVRAAWSNFLYIQSVKLPFPALETIFVWEALSTMLVGAALFKLGILQGRRSRRFYQNMTAICYAIGLTVRAIAADAVSTPGAPMTFAEAAGEWTRLITTVGHVGLVNLVLLSAAGTRLLRPFEAAGRTALTVYILQSVICLFILYPPWGLALYGDQSWAWFMMTALLVNAVLLWWAVWWVKRYSIAPVEWAWRSLVERRRLPFRARTDAAAVPA